MRWLALVALATACGKDPTPPPVATGSAAGSSVAAVPTADPAIGPIADPVAYCASTIKDAPPSHAPECTIDRARPIAIGPWLAAGLLRLSHDTISGEIVIRPAIQTAAGWWLIGAREDCGHLSEHGPCRITIVDARVKNDELDVTYRVSRTSEVDHQLHCTNGDAVACTYVR
jgi:hypothetical protein